jgi:phosphoenolpyruvate carboxykinase (GTP)
MAGRLPLIEEWFATIGDKLPTTLADELRTLRVRVAGTPAS